MGKTLIRLYPEYQACSGRPGFFFSEQLHRPKTSSVYACFISSLDGRIAIRRQGRETFPERLSNRNDLSFFYELEAQADCIISNGSYLRARAENRLGDILHIGRQEGDYAYLAEWRQQEGLAAQPLIALCSGSLDFPEPRDLPREKVLIATGPRHRADKLSVWRQKGYEVLLMNEEKMIGGLLIEELKRRHYKSIFLAAGPLLFESAFAGQHLNRLYLSLSHQILGGRGFRTLSDGQGLDLPPCRLQQSWLIYDCSSDLKHKQWYSRFNCRYSSATED